MEHAVNLLPEPDAAYEFSCKDEGRLMRGSFAPRINRGKDALLFATIG